MSCLFEPRPHILSEITANNATHVQRPASELQRVNGTQGVVQDPERGKQRSQLYQFDRLSNWIILERANL